MKLKDNYGHSVEIVDDSLRTKVTQMNEDITKKQNILTDEQKQAIADLHTDAFTDTYKTEVETMWADWDAMNSALTSLEGVI